MTFSNESEPLPVVLRLQPSVSFLKDKGRIHYQFSYFLGLYEDITAPPEHQVGIEYDIYRKYLQGRIGYNGDGVTIGVGSFVKPYNFSVAYIPTDFESRVSATVSFNLDSSGVGPFARSESSGMSDAEEELTDF